MTRSVTIAVLMTVLYPVPFTAEPAFSGDRIATPAVNYTPVNLGISKPLLLQKLLHPNLRKVGYCDDDNDDGAICARRGCGCGPAYDDDPERLPCCNDCYIPPGNTNGECQ